MKEPTVIAVLRDERFSPGAVAQDRDIMDAVVRRCPYPIRVIGEAQLTAADVADLYLSMGRLPQTLQLLADKEASGSRVVNRTKAIASCARSRIEGIMRTNGIPMPPLQSDGGYWLKRGDAPTQTAEDIVFCRTEAELAEGRRRFRDRGITDVVTSTHVEGDLVKFYCVGDDFFRYYHADATPSYYGFDAAALHATALRIAHLIGIEVYGGDCIVRPDGTFCMIDFNDWPSFSRCRAEAAVAIAELAFPYLNSQADE